MLIRIHHKGHRTGRGVSAGCRGGSVGHVVLGGSGLHRLLHGARSGSDKALPKSTDTRRPRLVSQKRKRHKQRLHPLPTKLAPATIKGARQPPHYAQQRAVGNLAAALHAADLASAKTGPAADATDDLRLAAGCRPSGGAVDCPPQAVTSRMCASGPQDFMREAWLRRL